MCIKIKNLNPVIKLETTHNIIITKFKVEDKHVFESIISEKKIFEDKIIEYSEEEINLTYDNFSYTEVMKRVLTNPDLEGEIPNSFEVIGRIAHLNLREKFSEYKYLIGRVILDVRTNNKQDRKHHVFRQ